MPSLGVRSPCSIHTPTKQKILKIEVQESNPTKSLQSLKVHYRDHSVARWALLFFFLSHKIIKGPWRRMLKEINLKS